MISAGIDIGSRTVKVVVIENEKVVASRKAENSFNTIDVCNTLLKGLNFDIITSTGYGRHLFADQFKCEVISEIKAFALGAHYLLPNCNTVLDIGGQDTKAISLNLTGGFNKFEMNDKCAAGTGRFLEIMAMTLRYSLDEFGESALAASEALSVNSMCTVFAESEIVSMLARGADRAKVARGIHQSIVNRSISLLRRVGVNGIVLFAGGVALNKCIVSFLEHQLNTIVFVPDEPQLVGAIGAAKFGLNTSKLFEELSSY